MAGEGLADGEGLAGGAVGLVEGDGAGVWSGDGSALGDTSAGVASGIEGDAEAIGVGTVVAGGSVAGGGEDDDEQAAPSIKKRMVFPATEMPGRVELMPRQMQEKCHASA